MKSIALSLVLSCIVIMSPESSESYRILGLFPFHGKSHFTMFEALMKGLARKGHQVDVVSCFPLNKPHPNYTDIVVIDPQQPQFINNLSYDRVRELGDDLVYFISKDMGNQVCELLSDPHLLNLIHNPPKNPPYDLVLTEIFGANCYITFGYHLKIPTIGVSSSTLYPWANGLIANPPNLAFQPNNIVNYVAPMTFWQRLHNTVYYTYNVIAFQYYSSSQTEIIRKYFGNDAPGIREIERSVALILSNSYPALNGPYPVTPGLIQVGGLHVQNDGTDLSPDLKEWMDNSTDGFLYFTFGSMITIESFPNEIIQVFYKSLFKIAPIRVLMKIADPKKLPPGLPKNVRTLMWAPQLKVLKHKNIKAFFTHGGLMSGQEAIHCAVPMIGMPIFADQYINVDLYVRKRIAVKLIYQEITEEKMDVALKEILYNPTYKNAVIKLSQRFLDRPMSAMDTAIWWVEYVIRHGSDAVRSPAMDLTWWQLELFDVYAALLSISLLAIFAIVTLFKFIFHVLFSPSQPKVSRSKKVT